MKHCTAIFALVLGLGAFPAIALTLDFPAAGQVTSETTAGVGQAELPVAAFADGSVEMREVSGLVQRSAWKLPMRGLTTFQILDPLRAQLEAAGYDVVFECADRTCGGFDFRFATDIVPEPAMYVDLGDFRYLLAQRSLHEAVALIVSRAPDAGFVQMTEVTPRDGAPPRVVTSSKSGAVVTPTRAPARATSETAVDTDLLSALRANGAAPLDDLTFDTGSAALSDGDFASLRDLADYMRDTPDAAVTLVGHTDDQGALAGNIALSKRRAQSVRARLVRDYGVAADRLSFEGVGFLAPRTANTTDAGRLANRRVEAILTP